MKKELLKKAIWALVEENNELKQEETILVERNLKLEIENLELKESIKEWDDKVKSVQQKANGFKELYKCEDELVKSLQNQRNDLFRENKKLKEKLESEKRLKYAFAFLFGCAMIAHIIDIIINHLN